MLSDMNSWTFLLHRTSTKSLGQVRFRLAEELCNFSEGPADRHQEWTQLKDGALNRHELLKLDGLLRRPA